MIEKITRYGVLVNTRYNVRSLPAFACYLNDMHDGWFNRLKTAIDRDGRSKRELSIAAGRGVNFLQQLFRDEKEPGADNLASILDVLGPEAALYVMTGLELSAEDQAFLTLLAQYSPEQKRAAREVIAAVLSHQVAAEPLPSPTATTRPTSAE